MRGCLATESEPCDDGTVARVVCLDEIRQETTALAYELEEAASRMVILRELAEMLRKASDPLREERDLDFRRAGVAFPGGIPGDDLLLGFPRERHSVLRHELAVFYCYDRRMVAGNERSRKRLSLLSESVRDNCSVTLSVSPNDEGVWRRQAS
jgi:hypothetical protein